MQVLQLILSAHACKLMEQEQQNATHRVAKDCSVSLIYHRLQPQSSAKGIHLTNYLAFTYLYESLVASYKWQQIEE